MCDAPDTRCLTHMPLPCHCWLRRCSRPSSPPAKATSCSAWHPRQRQVPRPTSTLWPASWPTWLPWCVGGWPCPIGVLCGAAFTHGWYLRQKATRCTQHCPCQHASVTSDLLRLLPLPAPQVCATLAQCGELFLQLPGVRAMPLLAYALGGEDTASADLLFDAGREAQAWQARSLAGHHGCWAAVGCCPVAAAVVGHWAAGLNLVRLAGGAPRAARMHGR